jgi:hypothetical protein
MAGEARSERILAEVAALIGTFLYCFAAGNERGELTRVNNVYAIAVTAGTAASWLLELSQANAPGDTTAVVPRISVASLQAAGFRVDDRFILGLRVQGLWLGRAPRVATPSD